MGSDKNNQPTFWNYLAGVLAGTLLNVYAYSIKGDIPIKNWLTFVSPAFTIMIALLLNWIVKEIVNWLIQRRIKKLIKFWEDLYNNPIYEAQRIEIKKNLMKIHKKNHEVKFGLYFNIKNIEQTE